MDGNVSKKTFSHKFFKLPFNRENTFVSIKKLLNNRLCSILDLYLQSLNLSIDPQFFASALELKIVVLELPIEQISYNIGLEGVLLTSQSAQIIYRCHVVLALASYLKIAPETVAINLVELLDFGSSNNKYESSFNLKIKITKSGRIDFLLSSLSLSNWLQQSLLSMQVANIAKDNVSIVLQLHQTPRDLFSVQYVRARCCSLLDLAVREKLIIREDNLNYSPWQLSRSRSISWLDAENNLWLKNASELNAIANLLTITDLFDRQSIDWHKQAINFSQTTGIFLTECRFLGAVKYQYPQLAIARLGLIMLCQYWLARISIEKLNIAAPTSL